MIRKIGVALCALLVVGVLIQILWYQIDGQPLDETLQYLSSSRYETEVRGDGSILFTPVTGNGHGLVIMHGALIKPISYANTAAYFAERGYTVLHSDGSHRSTGRIGKPTLFSTAIARAHRTGSPDADSLSRYGRSQL